MLNSQFPHLPVTRSNNPRRVRKRQRWAVLDQQFDDAANIHLFVVGEFEKPRGKFVDSFDLPSHESIMPCEALCYKGYS